jgi:4a-hydroxytetrahydrobiopterin dehydratase
MPKAPLLTEEQILSGLRTLRGWQRHGERLVKVMMLADFAAAVAFLARVSPIADEQNHHPDVSIRWNELTLTLWTHASGGLTARDLRLAEAIDALENEHAEA